MMDSFQPAVRPTMYFIGVTTRQSSINAVFPLWARRLGLGDCELRGMDFPVRADPARFRAAVEFIKRDPLSLGAYSHALPGHAEARAVLAAPVDDRLFFAGEATSPNFFSTAHGARDSGERAAREVIAAGKT